MILFETFNPTRNVTFDIISALCKGFSFIEAKVSTLAVGHVLVGTGVNAFFTCVPSHMPAQSPTFEYQKIKACPLHFWPLPVTKAWPSRWKLITEQLEWLLTFVEMVYWIYCGVDDALPHFIWINFMDNLCHRPYPDIYHFSLLTHCLHSRYGWIYPCL